MWTCPVAIKVLNLLDSVSRAEADPFRKTTASSLSQVRMRLVPVTTTSSSKVMVVSSLLALTIVDEPLDIIVVLVTSAPLSESAADTQKRKEKRRPRVILECRSTVL